MRSKEEANDYRYFPDPDLLPLEINHTLISELMKELPELPDEKRQRFMEEYALGHSDAAALTSSHELADYYEATTTAAGEEPKLSANWVTGELAAALNRESTEINKSPVSAQMMGGLIKRIADQTISGKIAKQVFEAMWQGEGNADTVIEAKGLKQITDSGAIEKIVDEIVTANPGQAEQYRSGKDKLFGFFVGQVMKATQGKANPQQVNALLKKRLASQFSPESALEDTESGFH